MEKHRKHLAAGLVLAAITAIVFARVQNYEFIVYDDFAYVVENPEIANGVTWEGIKGAFTTNYNSSWLPISIISHMIDIVVYGYNAGGHHTTNLLFHLCNVLLLYALLYRVTGAFGCSVAVAAFFAVHPMHVEPVAWVSSRKDMLSIFFLLTSLHAYVVYAQKKSWPMYALHFVLFVLGLGSKATLVIAPALLVIFDFWPLKRVNSVRDCVRVFAEKIPHGVLAVGRSAITLFVVDQGGSLQSLDEASFASRLVNVPYVYGMYIVKTFWPTNLTIIYERTDPQPVWLAITAFIILAIITIVFLRLWKSHPYLIAGWAWFGVSLFPVCGIVSFGDHYFADRYTYLAHIGLFITIVWGIHYAVQHFKIPKQVPIAATTFALIVCVVLSSFQVRHWLDSITVFEHAIRVNPRGSISHTNLGYALAKIGKHNEAIDHYRTAIEHRPDFAEAYNNLAYSLYATGQVEASAQAAAQAIIRVPDYMTAIFNLARAQLTLGDYASAQPNFAIVVDHNPMNPDAWNGLGMCQANFGQYEAAVESFTHVAAQLPTVPLAHTNLGRALADSGHPAEARAAYERALAIDPTFEPALNGMAKLKTPPAE